MVAGVLAGAGYYMGDTLLPANDANPKGYFESREVEGINEQMLRAVVNRPDYREVAHDLQAKGVPAPDFSKAQAWMPVHWLSIIPYKFPLRPLSNVIDMMTYLTTREPFCFKDPRFCYTLPLWRPYLYDDTSYVCVFREPSVTVASILKEVEREPYLQGLVLTPAQVLEMWACMYEHILRGHRNTGDWLFLHYDQVMTPAGLDRLERFTEAPVDRSFPEAALNRTRPPATALPRRVQRIYQQLCALAGYQR
jgi:hypothetical protein